MSVLICDFSKLHLLLSNTFRKWLGDQWNQVKVFLWSEIRALLKELQENLNSFWRSHNSESENVDSSEWEKLFSEFFWYFAIFRVHLEALSVAFKNRKSVLISLGMMSALKLRKNLFQIPQIWAKSAVFSGTCEQLFLLLNLNSRRISNIFWKKIAHRYNTSFRIWSKSSNTLEIVEHLWAPKVVQKGELEGGSKNIPS